MIKLIDITLTFPDGESIVTAVNNISLEVANGTITGITGPSGSGKSSLLAVASTLITPQQGEVIVDGINVNNLSDKERTLLRKDTLGIVFQQPNLIPSLTSLEQIYSVHAADKPKGFNLKKARNQAEELLDFVGLKDQSHKRPHQLSGGQRQRVNIARALSGNPTSLIIDEPTSALDQKRGREIIELIMSVTKEFNTSTMLVTHDQSHLPLMHQVVTMVDGSFLKN